MKDLLQGILFILAATILLALMLVLFVADAKAAADPNALTIQEFASHWLDWFPTGHANISGPMYDHFYYVDETASSRTKVTVKALRLARVFRTDYVMVIEEPEVRVDMKYFAKLSRGWPGEPNYVKPVEPNKPAEPNLAELAEIIDDTNCLLDAIK